MKREVVLHVAIVVVVLAAVFSIADYFYAAISVNAATSGIGALASINPSSTLVISSDTVALDVVPSASGTFKASSALNVSAYTNSDYNCEIAMTTSNTSLTSTQGQNTYTIPSLTSGSTYTQSTFTNDSWGYSLDNTNYNPVAASNSITTFSSTTANIASVYFATKLTQATKPGTYSGTVVFTTICTPPPLYMQDATAAELASRMPNIGDSTVLYDSRDDQEYTVAKLADGKYWMTKNLNLAGGTALSYIDTDFDSSYTLPTTDGWTVVNNKLVLPISDNSDTSFSTNNVAYVYNSGSETCGDNSPCYSYYSWDAATLGSGRSITTSDQNAPYSICSKGWHLPTTYGGSGSAAEATDYRALMIALGGSNSVPTYNSTTTPTGATLYGLIGPGTYTNFVLSGDYYDGLFYYGGSYGDYWSSTVFMSTDFARLFYFNSTSFYSANNGSRANGIGVRCVFSS